MNSPVIDCTGLDCPQPVLEARKRIQEDRPGQFCVVVDNDAAKENVTRFLQASGYGVDVERDGNLWRLCATDQVPRGQAAPNDAQIPPCPIPGASTGASAATDAHQRFVVFLTSDVIGHGDDMLGSKLMGNFIPTLKELGNELWRIVMLNGAVKLATTPGPVLDGLKELENDGIDILVCGTCLEHFGLVDKRDVGQTTNMLDVVTSLQLATKIIKP